jgi:hypothetical protein
MSALPQALPLALSAAFYPPTLLVLLALLTGGHPRRLVLAYFAGAAILTTGAGLIALVLLTQTGATTQESSTASGWLYIAVGMVLLALSRWAWQRKAREPTETRDDSGASRRRIAEWSQRATKSQKWAFALGLLMFLPSPLYLLAIKEISDSGDAKLSNVLAVLICALAVMLFVEVPLVAMFVRPDGVTAGIQRFHRWLRRNGWSFAAGLALIAGISAIAQGIDAQLENCSLVSQAQTQLAGGVPFMSQADAIAALERRTYRPRPLTRSSTRTRRARSTDCGPPRRSSRSSPSSPSISPAASRPSNPAPKPHPDHPPIGRLTRVPPRKRQSAPATQEGKSATIIPTGLGRDPIGACRVHPRGRHGAVGCQPPGGDRGARRPRPGRRWRRRRGARLTYARRIGSRAPHWARARWWRRAVGASQPWLGVTRSPPLERERDTSPPSTWANPITHVKYPDLL